MWRWVWAVKEEKGTLASWGRLGERVEPPREGSRVVSWVAAVHSTRGAGGAERHSSTETICSQPYFTPAKTETRRREGAGHGGKKSVRFRSLSPTDHPPVHIADHTTSC